jgi:hypothetical protein
MKMKISPHSKGPRSVSLSHCPKCSGEGKIWDFSDHEEPSFYYCDLCKGVPRIISN